MKIILTQKISGLGNKGEIKDVNDGYARNFLLPKKLAELANIKSIERVEKEKIEKTQKEKENEEKIKALAEKIKGKIFIIEVKSENEKLFGSIGKKEIANAIGDQIDEDMIELDENIKETGEKSININFGYNIKVKVIIKITGEDK